MSHKVWREEMSESDKQKVLTKWPDAHWHEASCTIWKEPYPHGQTVIGFGMVEERAWADAAARLPELAPEPAQPVQERKSLFICAAWKAVEEGPILNFETMERRKVVFRCDLPEGHEGDHVDSVILVNWPQPVKERKFTDRGFEDYTEFRDTYGSLVTVRQSSSAERDAVWIFCKDNPHMKEPSPHLSPEQAEQVADALMDFVKQYSASSSAGKPDSVDMNIRAVLWLLSHTQGKVRRLVEVLAEEMGAGRGKSDV